MKDGTANYELANALCDLERKNLLKDLRDYCTVLEIDGTLLDHLNEYIVVA